MLNAGPWLFGRERGAGDEIAEDCLEIADPANPGSARFKDRGGIKMWSRCDHREHSKHQLWVNQDILKRVSKTLEL